MTQKLRPSLRLGAVAFALGLVAVQAQAQTSPWYVGVNQRFEHHTNLFNAASGQVADTVSQTSLVGGLDIPVGRQRVFATAALSHVRYQDRGELSHDGHNVTAGINWETIGNLAGTIAFDSSRTLADFNAAGLPGVTSNNITSTSGARATARMGVVTRLSVDLSASTRRTRYDNPAYLARNLNVDEFYGGVRYRPAGSLVLGAGLRATRGEYPNFRNPAPGRYTPEGFDRNNIDLSADWPLSGASRVEARVSFGKDSYDTITSRDYSGVTGEVTWRWQPTGRTNLTTSFSRRSGDEASITTTPGVLPYATAANRVSNTLSANADYELTGKIKVRGSVSYIDATTIDLLTQATGSDKTTAMTLGLVWEATRTIRAGCDVTARRRAAGTGVIGYTSEVYGCFGEFVLR